MFANIEEAVDETNDIVSMTFDLECQCFDKDDILTKAKELGLNIKE